MPCDTTLRSGQTLAERMEETRRALKRLEQQLLEKRVRVIIAQNGAVAFDGWKDKDGVTDVCAYRTLASQNSWALRQAVAQAEATQGRKVNPRAVAAGHHSHDGGKNWHGGH